ncbi:MAG TPA: orotidine-5'-phosphate decarboxylase [Pyrinomonadaceae bacterium]
MTTGTAGAVSAKEKLIVALDVETADEALRLFGELREEAGMFKVGSQLFTAAGPDLVRKLVGGGARIFLDLKFHDIPNTVAAAAREAVRLGVTLFNVHASGGGEMMRRAAEATSEEAARLGVEKPSLIAVTVLTSMDADALAESGVAAATVEEQVRRLAQLADASGLDGVVASPHEIRPVREAVGRAGFLVVTPGVHPSASAYADQKRVTSPSEAIQRGADFIVVGRAILNSPDPAQAARVVVEEMEKGSRQ